MKNLIDSACDFIYIVDRNGKIIYVNEYGAKYLNSTPEQIIGKALSDIFPPPIAEGQKKNIQIVFDSNKPLNFERKLPFYNKEAWLDSRLVPLADEMGKVTSVLGISRDISERKTLEEKNNDEIQDLHFFQELAVGRELKMAELENKIKEMGTLLAQLNAGLVDCQRKLEGAEKKFQTLFNAAPVAIGIADRTGNVFAVNRAMEELTGYNLEEYQKIKVEDTYVDPGDRARLLQTLESASSAHDFEVKLKRKDGAVYWCLVNVDLIELDGQVVLLTTARDITELKQIKTALQKLAEKT
ncbi:MAG: PAS domain S-box protein [Candidatus Margulisiibacteriota bacterium]